MPIPIPPPSSPPQEPTTSSQTKDPTTLPPAALDLAAKLFDLARSGSTTTLTPYIEAGIPPNLTNHEGNTLLMLAAYNGHLSTTEVLLSNGADPNVLNERGQSPIAGAVFKGYDEIVRVLVEKGADVWKGQPNAVDCARMFKRDEALRIMGVEE
jgi:ankyrin repeat protein